MAESISNYRIGSAQVTFGGTNLGYTDEDTTVAVTSEYADITVDKYGSTLVSQRVMGREVVVNVTLKQTSKSDLADVWANVFPANDAADAAKLTLSDETGDDMRAVADVLVLQRRNASDDTEDFTVWKAVAEQVGEINLDNQGMSTMTVTFRGYIDETNGLITIGDSDG